MNKYLMDEWKNILSDCQLYIYGAKKTAERFYEFIESIGYKENVKGFLVTDKKDNPIEIAGLPVIEARSMGKRNARILVPHAGKYKEQILNLLQKLGFSDVVSVSILRDRTWYDGNVNPYDDVGTEIYIKKGEYEKAMDAALRNRIYEILENGQPDFGAIKPYQSMEKIGLRGVRPTTYRVSRYGMNELLNQSMDVLDIGCNTAFIDMTVAEQIKTITGIEYDHSLVKIAEMVRDYLKISNCTIVNTDFDTWYNENRNLSYDVIFSFAIHHWLDLSPDTYVSRLHHLLRADGYLFMESHVESDTEYEKCLYLMEKMGYEVIKTGLIKDDGISERKFAVLRKKADM